MENITQLMIKGLLFITLIISYNVHTHKVNCNEICSKIKVSTDLVKLK